MPVMDIVINVQKRKSLTEVDKVINHMKKEHGSNHALVFKINFQI